MTQFTTPIPCHELTKLMARWIPVRPGPHPRSRSAAYQQLKTLFPPDSFNEALLCFDMVTEPRRLNTMERAIWYWRGQIKRPVSASSKHELNYQNQLVDNRRKNKLLILVGD